MFAKKRPPKKDPPALADAKFALNSAVVRGEPQEVQPMFATATWGSNGTVKANKYRPFSASNPVERVGDS